VWEKIRERLEEAFTHITGMKSRLISWGRDIGLKGNQNLLKG